MILLAFALAITEPPAKMVILNGAAGVAIIAYPSMERCELAKRALEALIAKGEPYGAATMQRTGVSVYCVPG